MIGRIVRRAIVSGVAGGLTSTAALVAAALVERRGAAQPLNATSHWLHGDRAARQPSVDLAHTGVGLATHLAATIFWAAFFETWLVVRRSRGTADLGARAAVVAASAAVVDYTITPKRFTPGWELVLSKSSMALVYAAMAAGFVAARGAP